MSVNQKTVGQTVVGSAAAVAAAASGATGAHAQGAVADWQGPYVGGHLGLASLSSSPSGSTTQIGTGGFFGGGYGASNFGGTESVGTSTANTLNVGGQFGWNFQNQHLVFGPEVGFSWLGTSRAQSHGMMNRGYTSAPYTYNYSGNTVRSSRIGAVMDLKGRVGWDFNGTLPYLTAGFALARESSSFTINGVNGFGAVQSFTSSKSSWKPGFVVGGGLEQQIAPGWSVRGEISWMDFATQKLANPAAASVPAYGASASTVGLGGEAHFSDSVWNATVGVNYSF